MNELMVFEYLFRWMMWCGQLTVFCEESDFGTICPISLLLLINYDDDVLCRWNTTCKNEDENWWWMHVCNMKVKNDDELLWSCA
jgi:hypothetical protein